MITEEQAMRLLVEANPVPDMSTLDPSGDLLTTHLADPNKRSSEMTQLKSRQTDNPPGPRRRRLIWVAAAVLAIVVAGVVLTQTGDEASVADTPSPVETATAFIEAYRGSFDVDEAFSYLGVAPVAAGLDTSGAADHHLLARFREATGTKLFDLQCEETNFASESTVVSCTYMTHDFFSDEMGLGPYGPTVDEFTVADGKIVSVAEGVGDVVDFSDPGGFSKQIGEPFAAWMGENHPQDLDVMYDPYPNGWNITEESIPLWGQRLREYVADQAGPLGVFESARGLIVFRDGSQLKAVDPDDPSSVNTIDLPREIVATELMVAGWSADGSKLALTDEDRGLYVVDRTGSAVQVAPDLGGCCAFVTHAWLSPDGTKGLDATNNEIVIFDLDGGAVTQRVELDQQLRWWPVWAPDGAQVAFQGEGEALGIVDLVTGTSRELIGPGRFVGIRQIAWSPDGSRLLVVALHDPLPFDPDLNPLVNPRQGALYLVDIDDGETRQIAEGYYVTAAWSPHSTRIAAIDYHPDGRDLVVMNADGTGLRVLAEKAGGLFTGVAWHPVPGP